MSYRQRQRHDARRDHAADRGDSGRFFDVPDPRSRAASLRPVCSISNLQRSLFASARAIARRSGRPLPPVLPRCRARQSARASTRGLGHEVGGDFYDVCDASAAGRFGVVIVDVQGMGRPPPAVTALARYTVAGRTAMHDRSPAVCSGRSNDAMLAQAASGASARSRTRVSTRRPRARGSRAPPSAIRCRS